MITRQFTVPQSETAATGRHGRSAEKRICRRTGIPTELKTLTVAGRNTVKNAIESAAEQGLHIVIDARGVAVTPQEAANAILRAQGNVGGLEGRVLVITREGAVTF